MKSDDAMASGKARVAYRSCRCVCEVIGCVHCIDKRFRLIYATRNKQLIRHRHATEPIMPLARMENADMKHKIDSVADLQWSLDGHY